jgi:hypothetical protein
VARSVTEEAGSAKRADSGGRHGGADLRGPLDHLGFQEGGNRVHPIIYAACSQLGRSDS